MHGHSNMGLASLIAFLVIAILTILILCVLMLISMWKVYVKSGQKGWAALIPFYNQAKMLEMTGEPLWWMALLLIPIVNVFVIIAVTNRLSRAFGHSGWFTAGLLLLPFVFWPILAFGSSQYRYDFPPVAPITPTIKWTLAAAGFMGLYYMMSVLSFSNSNSDLHPLTIIKSSDDSSGAIFATDGRYVYDNDTMIAGADPLSFKSVGDYELDDYHAYYEGALMPRADAGSFSALSGEYAVDSVNAYYAGTALANSDISSFKALDSDYATDQSKVYFDGQTIAAADSASFKILDSDYAIDRSAVYSDGQPIQGADSASFTLLGSGYAKDNNAVYSYGTVIPGADSKTFKLVSGNDSDGNYDAKDKNTYYSDGSPLSASANQCKQISTNSGE